MRLAKGRRRVHGKLVGRDRKYIRWRHSVHRSTMSAVMFRVYMRSDVACRATYRKSRVCWGCGRLIDTKGFSAYNDMHVISAVMGSERKVFLYSCNECYMGATSGPYSDGPYD